MLCPFGHIRGGENVCELGAKVVFMNEIDMKERGIAPGSFVEQNRLPAMDEGSARGFEVLSNPAGIGRRILHGS
jgi:hypothetical protein